MRTAEEILKEQNLNLLHETNKKGREDLSKILDESFAIGEFAWLISAINEARKEAIEECAKVAFYKGFDKCKNDDSNCFEAWREEGGTLITNILKELK